MYVVALEILLFVDALVQDFSGLGIHGESCFLLLNVGGDGCGVRRFSPLCFVCALGRCNLGCPPRSIRIL